MSNEVSNVILNDLQLFWAKLDKPVEPFGTLQWEIQVRFPKKRIKEMEQYGKVKETDEAGVYSVNFKKKAQKKDGSPAARVKLVDRKGDELESKYLGNGSTGNVKLMLKPYEIKGPKGNVTKSGTQVMLVAVQVTDLIKYEPKGGVDFDYDDEEEQVNEPASKPVAKTAAAKKAAGRKPAAMEDDDDEIPF